MAYVSKNCILDGAGKALGASETATVVSETLRHCNPLHIVCDFYVSAVTDGGADSSVIAKIQSTSGQDNWVDAKAGTAITTTGWKSIRINAATSGDDAYLPLRPHLRLVATTAAGDALTITHVIFSYHDVT
jgi:hypothetical protein